MKYEIKIDGAKEAKGTVNLRRFAIIAESIHKIAELAFEMKVKGTVFSSKIKKKQLDEALNVNLLGIDAGSTIIMLEADTFADSLNPFWDETSLKELKEDFLKMTPVSLFVSSFQEAIKDDPSPDLLDKSILKELNKLKRAFFTGDEILNISNQDSIETLTINIDTFHKIKIFEENIPSSKAVIINGVVESLKFSKKMVTIKSNEGIVEGFLSNNIEPEQISIFWGKEVTIIGTLNYQSGGNSIIEIEKIFQPSDGDQFFSQNPKSESIDQQIERQFKEGKKANSLDEIIGQWPGDETFEELIKMLSK